ncbi:dTDP-4-dehydrorhamnose reductase [Rivularia sp. UHCC 0363]|uniref:dTDP-4-dehydrorhamnose reductase n=1 Tax=Rivularia sp. UHCC 0363 TaxID=3110244 RepID=UPI002B214C49|nr:dTDP-4-dehydrorhamnose reductase [Rivularia sp. UHCC 0363]MEA5594377.1 dTDP-4-dehydrorhamnose reductase [Rivularia sp. UHCC 0363]
MTKSILLIGCKGQVGTQLQKTFEPCSNLTAVARPIVELAQPETLRDLIRENQPSIIINAAAYTAVDKAESEPELANTINAVAPEVLAQEAERLRACLIHISTDYVFDGKTNNPYQENHPTNPLSVYGKTKLAGEEAIRSNCSNHFILRTAWVYGTGGKSNFVKTMLRLGSQKPELKVVADQIGSPTWSKDIAQIIAALVTKTPQETGTYHYTNSGVASWYDFAIAIFEEAKHLGFPLQIERVIPITTSEYPTPATRPSYSVLNCAKISTIIESHPPHWRQSLREMLQEFQVNQ